MPAKDIYHQLVRRGLEKDGWTITHDPLHIDLVDIEVYIDLGAERLIAAERDNEKIAVEIKSFIGGSAISQFHLALGQFLNYRFTLKKSEPERILYLAVTYKIYSTFFQKAAIQEICKEYSLKLLVYHINSEEIIEWIN